MITSKGRSLPDLCLSFTQNEIRIFGLRLEEGEDPAILIDQLQNKARIHVPFEECQRLAALHRYELVVPWQEEETFVSHIEKVLSLM